LKSARVLSPDQAINPGAKPAEARQVYSGYRVPLGLTRYSVVGACLLRVPFVYCASSQPGPTACHGTRACVCGCGCGCAAAALAAAAPVARTATQTPMSAANRPRRQTLVNIPAPPRIG